jgi:hypothetical protein
VPNLIGAHDSLERREHRFRDGYLRFALHPLDNAGQAGGQHSGRIKIA